MLPLGFPGLTAARAESAWGKCFNSFKPATSPGAVPRDLSGGEKQRVALARALAPEPRLLLLDEPFNGLDADLKASILEKLTAWLAERNIPALYVSHDVAEAFQTAADVMVIEGGQIQAHGPAQVVLAGRREQLLRQLGAT